MRVWNEKNHRLTNSLRGHGTDNKCLRVAWEGGVWFRRGGLRGGDREERSTAVEMTVMTSVAKEEVIISWCPQG